MWTFSHSRRSFSFREMVSGSPAAFSSVIVPLRSVLVFSTPEGRPPLAYKSAWYCWALSPVEMAADARSKMEIPVIPSLE